MSTAVYTQDTESVKNTLKENPIYVAAKLRSYTLIVLCQNETEQHETYLTMLNSGSYENVRKQIKVQKYTEYRIEPMETAFNVFPELRIIFPPGSVVFVVSIYHYSGQYRQQNICRVLAIRENRIRDVTSLVKSAIHQKYNTTHYGIQTDTSAFASDIVHTLAGQLYGDSHALIFDSVPHSYQNISKKTGSIKIDTTEIDTINIEPVQADRVLVGRVSGKKVCSLDVY